LCILLHSLMMLKLVLASIILSLVYHYWPLYFLFLFFHPRSILIWECTLAEICCFWN
jgi:hypothetical protein